MGVSTHSGVSDYANTSDGRAAGVVALNSGDEDHIGGPGVSVRTGAPIGSEFIIAQNGSYLITEAGDRLITEG